MRSLVRSFGTLRPYWPLALAALISLIAVTATNLASPRILGAMIDDGIRAARADVLINLGALLLGIAVVRGVVSFTQGYASEKLSQSVAYDLRNELFARIQALSFSYHDRAQTGQLMTRITSDVEQLRSFVGMGLLQLVSAIAMTVGSVVALFSLNPLLAAVTMLTIPATGVIVVYFMRVVRPLFSQIQARLGVLNTVLQENLAGVRVVQAFAREPYEAQRYRAANEALLEVNIKAVYGLSSAFPLIFLISNLGTLAVVWLGGFQVFAGSLTIGGLVAFNTYLALLIQPLMMLGMIMAQVTRAAVGAERIYEILDAPSEVTDRPDARPLDAIDGRIAFEQVSFGYGAHGNADAALILRDVSFVAEPGMTVAILGETGSGKSTIINLIPRFYDVTAGRVTIDGHDVRDVTLESLRRQIGIVLQDATLFSGSIRDNIAYGRPDALADEITAAARAAQADAFIAALPAGYDTIIGERGVTLSGGQRQRIAIARALLRDPRILILDDSTSAVDAETEYQIQQALATLMRGRTSFVIAQRISTVRSADLIIVLAGGRIAAAGNHDDLLRESALYGEIIDSQFGEHAEPAAPAAVAEALVRP